MFTVDMNPGMSNLQGLRVMEMANFSLGSCTDIDKMHISFSWILTAQDYLNLIGININ